MKKKWLFIPALLLLLNVSVFVYKGYGSDRTHPNIRGTEIISITPSGFSPNRIVVSKGDTVSLMVHNLDNKKHNFVLKDLYIFTHNLNPDETTSLKFKAYKKGTFPFVSDTPGKPEKGYAGVFVVK